MEISYVNHKELTWSPEHEVAALNIEMNAANRVNGVDD